MKNILLKFFQNSEAIRSVAYYGHCDLVSGSWQINILSKTAQLQALAG